jgi:hypothetical protein
MTEERMRVGTYCKKEGLPRVSSPPVLVDKRCLLTKLGCGKEAPDLTKKIAVL